MSTRFLYFVFFTFIFSFQVAFAQQNFVYDGDDFNVWLKTDDSNNELVDVYFTDEGQWNKFTIIDFELFKNENEGFRFTAQDGAGRVYWIDYYRNKKYIIVTDAQDKESWKLYQREQ